MPRAPLVGFVLALFALVGSGWALAARVGVLFGELLHRPLLLAASGQSATAHAQQHELLRQLFGLCAWWLLAVVVAVGFGRFLVQGPAFARGAGAAQQSFPPLAVSRTASALWCLGLALVSALTVADWARIERASLLSITTTWTQRALVLSAGALLVDVAFARSRYLASLWLTRREFADAQRAAFGAPELRAAREQVRHAVLHARAERPASTQAGP